MIYRNFGNTGLEISIIGFGAGEIGDLAIEDAKVDAILNFALDNGINLIDTARGYYYASEDRIGKFISHRFFDSLFSQPKLATELRDKEDWSYECIIAGVDEARRSMIRILILFPPCPLAILQRGDVIIAFA